MSFSLDPLVRSEGGKIILLVIDGLGGLPDPDRGVSEMEAAQLPHLDALAARSSVGRVAILPPGLTPGSGPGHLSLFGQDPLTVDLGRGVLEALGCDYPLDPAEVAARGNFCTLDGDGIVTDRRAGRPSDGENRRLCAMLTEKIRLEGIEFQLLPGKQHRFTLVLSGDGLGHHLNDNDPQVEGKPPLEIVGRDTESERTAGIVASFLEQACEILANEPAASGMLLRGFSKRPAIASYQQRYSLRAAACAIYPMYRGIARLCGMDMLEPGTDLSEQFAAVGRSFDNYDFFFIHTKEADQAGHNGEFDEKVAVLEDVDRRIPELVDLGADVVMITGDHSTPTLHREHSWHPVPLILSSHRTIPVPDATFDERGVLRGDLGTVPGPSLMTLAMAHAGRLAKFGA